MDKTEKSFKILLDLVLFIICFFILETFINVYSAFIFAVIIAHTLNWIFNGHIFALLKTFKIVKTKSSSFLYYIEKLKEKGTKEKSIKCIATFGSISREELKETSDLDIRIVRAKGLINGIRSSFFVMSERSMAFFNGFPLDIYLCDDVNCIKNLEELPVSIYDPDHLLNSFKIVKKHLR